MARPKTKTDLIDKALSQFDKLNRTISTMTKEELSRPFDFSQNKSKKQAHWQRDKNLRDVLIHLFEWHQLLLSWVLSNLDGKQSSFLPSPYNWRTYGQMNVMFLEKHQKTSLNDAYAMFKQSHADVMALIHRFSNEELFSKSEFHWVGGSTLGSHCVSATSSHYNWAIKKIESHQKNLMTNDTNLTRWNH